MSFDKEHFNETYRSLITISMEALKFLSLANGGAAVAILAYLGSASANPSANVPDMSSSMASFLAGIFFCGLGFLFSYITQLKLLGEIRGDSDEKLGHTFYLSVAVTFSFASLLSFACGSWVAVGAFRSV